MATVRYHDAAEFGLPFLVPGDPDFEELVNEIVSRPEPFDRWRTGSLDRAAVLLNQTGRAIVTIALIWKYMNAEGRSYTSTHSNLGASTQTDFLSGRGGVVRDLGTFILPGSKRLITEDGMFGNNLDVLGPQEGFGGYIGTGFGGRGSRGEHEAAEVELVLDAAVLDDGLVVGPDDGGLFERLSGELETQRNTAREIVEKLRNGAGAGEIFQILRPLAKHGATRLGFRSAVLTMFANTGIRHLIDWEGKEWADWFEGIAAAEPVRLQKAGRPGGPPH